MDLSLVVPQSRLVPIKNPVTEEPTGLVIKLLPMSSPKVKAAQRAITNARLSARKAKVTAEQIESQSTDLIVAAIDGWEWGGDADFQGQKLEFTEANLRKVLKIDWLRKQIDDELGDDAAFFQS